MPPISSDSKPGATSGKGKSDTPIADGVERDANGDPVLLDADGNARDLDAEAADLDKANQAAADEDEDKYGALNAANSDPYGSDGANAADGLGPLADRVEVDPHAPESRNVGR